MGNNYTYPNQTMAQITKIPPEKRQQALLDRFGSEKAKEFEVRFCCAVRNLSSMRNNGPWILNMLDEDGLYLAPAPRITWNLFTGDRSISCRVSADAFGLIVTLVTVADLVCSYPDSHFGGQMMAMYFDLLMYAEQHAESHVIFACIQ